MVGMIAAEDGAQICGELSPPPSGGGNQGGGGGGGPDPAEACPDEFGPCRADAAEGGCMSILTNAGPQGPDMGACSANAACMPLMQCMSSQGGGEAHPCPHQMNACNGAAE